MKSCYSSHTDFDKIATILRLEAISMVNVGLNDDAYNQ